MSGHHIIALIVCVGILACSEPTSPRRAQGVRAQLDDAHLTIENHRNAPIYTFIVDADLVASINWAACRDPLRCDGVAAHSRRTVPVAEIIGWDGTGGVMIYWWELRFALKGGFRPDSIRAAYASR